MDRPPAPLLRDYRSAIDSGSVWVTGTPVVGLISLIPADDVLLIENVRSTPTCRAPASGGG